MSDSVKKLDEMRERLDELAKGTADINGKPSKAFFGPTSRAGTEWQWTAIWSIFGETLTHVYHSINKELRNSTLDDARLADLKRQVTGYAGGVDRLIWEELDEPTQQAMDQWRLGERILVSVLQVVADVYAEREKIFAEGATPVPGFPPLRREETLRCIKMVERIHLGYLHDLRRILRPASLLGPEEPKNHGQFGAGSQLIKDCWAGGIFHTEPLPTQAAVALAYISRKIASDTIPNSKYSMTVDDSDPLIHLEEGPRSIGKSLAKQFTRNTKVLLEHKEIVESRGYTQTGILENGTTEMDRIAIERIFKSADQGSFFVYAPTSSGKTRLALLAILEAVSTRKKRNPQFFGNVVFLAPTKALVAQIATDLRRLVSDSDAAHWQIIEGTRDHPQFNQHLRTGRFDIAVVIPEKLAAMLRVGMTLDKCPLLVIDEMQHIVDGQRGTDLELLLIEIIERYPDLRWVGLSASLGLKTRGLMHDWLEANGSLAEEVNAVHRPVPLEVSAVDPHTTFTRAIHLDGLPKESWTGPSKLNELISRLEPAKRSTAAMYRRPLEQLFKLLREHDEGGILKLRDVPSTLFFVSSKLNARKLANVVIELMNMAFIDPIEVAAKKPYVESRFTKFSTLDNGKSPESALEEFEQLSPGRLKRDLARCIVSGIGFHTATLDSHGRQLVESAFIDGYIRILFATDTLKLGVNLPSDVVINGDMHLSSSQGYKMLDRDTVIQRLGRAGRLGLKHQGHGYLISPDEFPNSPRIAANLHIGVEELQGLGDGEERKVITAVRQADKVFNHYLADWTAGAEYLPQLNDKWFELAVLRRILFLVAENGHLDQDTLVAQAKSIHARTLAGVHGSSFPDGFLNRLDRKGCIQTSGSGIRLTSTGYALSVNSIDPDNAEIVASICEAVDQGAGPFTLLFMASNSPVALSSTRGMFIQNLPSGIEQKILKEAKKFFDSDRVRHPRYFRNYPDQMTDVFGTGKHADVLRRYITDEDLDSPDSARTLTAIWRASLLLHRWGGQPLSFLEDFHGSQKWIPEEVEIQQIADATSFVLGAASDQLGTAPLDMGFRTLQQFATEVESGLPQVLSRLTRSNLRGVTRDRLLGLLDYLDDPNFKWDSIIELLDRYMAENSFRPKSIEGRSRRSSPDTWVALSPATLDRLKKTIDEADRDKKFFSKSLPDPWGIQRIPRDHKATLSDELENLRRDILGIDTVAGLLEECGLDVSDVPDKPYRLAVKGSKNLELISYVEIVDELITNTDIEKLLESLKPDENLMIISAGGASDGVMHRSHFQREPCAIVEPSLFMEMVARVYERYYVEGDPMAGEAGGDLDIIKTEALLTIMLKNNAPVLTRTDLENRLRSVDLVPSE